MIECEGVVVEVLPNTVFRVKLTNGHIITAQGHALVDFAQAVCRHLGAVEAQISVRIHAPLEFFQSLS